MKRHQGLLGLVAAMLLLAAPLTACSSTQAVMRGKVLAKTHRRAVAMNVDDGSQYLALAIGGHVSVHATPHVTTHAGTPHTTGHTAPAAKATRVGGATVKVPKADAGRVGVTKITKPVTTTAGKTAVRTVKTSGYTNNRWFKQSPTRHTYFPFWYLIAFSHHDRHERYLLTLRVGEKTRQLSVSRRMYQKVHVGDYVQVNGSNFEVLRKR